MANLYLRLPKYVASYIRNKREYAPIGVGEPVIIDPTSYLYMDFIHGLTVNTYSTVSEKHCFCEKQWQRMMKGYSIERDKLRRNVRLLTDRIDQLTLTDDEVSLLSGTKRPKGEVSGEYLCIRIPPEVRRGDRMVSTNGHWQLSHNAASTVRSLMTDDFWRGFLSFMSRGKQYCIENHTHFVSMEYIERFMARYDIYNGIDNKMRNNLKRNLNRKGQRIRNDDEEYIEFGSTLMER